MFLHFPPQASEELELEKIEETCLEDWSTHIIYTSHLQSIPVYNLFAWWKPSKHQALLILRLSSLIIQLICRVGAIKACNLTTHHASRIVEMYLKRDVELHLKSRAIIALYLLSLEVLEIRYVAYKTSCT